MSDACDHIAGVPVVDLARRFGTPTFVYDAAVIRQKIADSAAFDVVRFAQKACSNLAILDLVRRHGVLVDAVSAGEIRRALTGRLFARRRARRRSSIRPTSSTASRSISASAGIHVNCGSPDMIDQLGSRAPGRDITLRINPGFGHGHSQKTNTGGDQSKHGIWHEQIGRLPATGRPPRAGRQRAAHAHRLRHRPGAPSAGLRGAWKMRPREVGRVADARSAPAAGCPFPTGRTIVRRSGRLFRPLGRHPASGWKTASAMPLRLEIEPGRYLVAESGYLVAEIRAVKRQGENMFYLLDAGFNNLARPILYGAYHPMSIVPADGRPPRPEHDVIVGGPLCESGDIFTQEEGGFVVTRRLPEAAVGDLLVIECAGAYGFVMGSNYNSKPLAAEVLIARRPGPADPPPPDASKT